jgi:hemerythrin superfamily protein
MKAHELLMKQHRLVEELFEQFEDAEETREKREIFAKLAQNLVAHDAIERELFYPACERELGSEDDVLGESLVEHGLVEFCLFRADQRQSAQDFDKYVSVLKEVVEHHVEEEEGSLLPRVKRELDADQLDALGEKMEQRFEKAMESDFREPLRENLDQVLAGRTKTTKKAASSKGGRALNSRSKSQQSEARMAKRRRARSKPARKA